MLLSKPYRPRYRYLDEIVERTDYKAIFNLAKDAINAGKLKTLKRDSEWISETCLSPTKFLTWAKIKDIKFHPVLEELVLHYSSSSKKMRPNQEAKLKTQKCAKKIWNENPTMTIASMCNHEEILSYSKKYELKTRNNWLSEIAPPAVKKGGRPKGAKKLIA